MLAQLLVTIEVRVMKGLLKPRDSQRSNCLRKRHRARKIHPLVCIHHDVDVRPDSLSHPGKPLDIRLEIRRSDLDLYSTETSPDIALRSLEQLG